MGGLLPISSGHWVRGRLYFGQVVSPAQGNTHYTHTLKNNRQLRNWSAQDCEKRPIQEPQRSDISRTHNFHIPGIKLPLKQRQYWTTFLPGLSGKMTGQEEDWKGTQSHLCKVCTVINDLQCHVISVCWSTVFYEVQNFRVCLSYLVVR